MNLRKLQLLSSFLVMTSTLLQSCATGPGKEPKAPDSPPQVDYLAVQESLGIHMASDDTGFREKKFNACGLGDSLAALPIPLRDCKQAYFAVIQFELSCRQEDQPSDILTGASLLPLDDREFKWTIGETQGKSRTDPHGRGAIRVITQKSQRRAPVRISNGTDYLIIRANELSTIATPPNWCDVR